MEQVLVDLEKRLMEAETPADAIRDFLYAVDSGFLGTMPSGFNDSAFVTALRQHATYKR